MRQTASVCIVLINRRASFFDESRARQVTSDAVAGTIRDAGTLSRAWEAFAKGAVAARTARCSSRAQRRVVRPQRGNESRRCR